MADLTIEEKQKNVLEALKAEGFEACVKRGMITVVTKSDQPLSKERQIRAALILKNYSFPGYFSHPRECIVVTDGEGIILEHDDKILLFSSREKFWKFRDKFVPDKIRFFLHELNWEVAVKNLGIYFQDAIMDCDGELGLDEKPIYYLIPLIGNSEIGGAA